MRHWSLSAQPVSCPSASRLTGEFAFQTSTTVARQPGAGTHSCNHRNAVDLCAGSGNQRISGALSFRGLAVALDRRRTDDHYEPGDHQTGIAVLLPPDYGLRPGSGFPVAAGPPALLVEATLIVFALVVAINVTNFMDGLDLMTAAGIGILLAGIGILAALGLAGLESGGIGIIAAGGVLGLPCSTVHQQRFFWVTLEACCSA